MYNKDSLIRRIKKEGIEPTIKDLCSTKFSDNILAELETAQIFKNGHPNIAFIRSLVAM